MRALYCGALTGGGTFGALRLDAGTVVVKNKLGMLDYLHVAIRFNAPEDHV